MKKLGLVIMSGLLLAAPFSWGISRVGGGSVASLAQGYSLDAAPMFGAITILGPEMARFEGPMGLNFGGGVRGGGGFSFSPFAGTPYIDLLEFRVEYPGFVKLTRVELRTELVRDGWTEIKARETCLTAFIKESQTATFAIATWGEGFGYVLVSRKSNASRIAIEGMVQSTKLEGGACRWK
jgi:hypothetical protein